MVLPFNLGKSKIDFSFNSRNYLKSIMYYILTNFQNETYSAANVEKI